jgi:hydrogenase-4 component F
MGTSVASEIRGLLRILPASGALLVIGLFAVTGSPPFGLFISEFTILRAAFTEQHPWIAASTILLLVVIFVGIAGMILELAYGKPVPSHAARGGGGSTERASLVVAPALLAAIVLLLGVHIPAPLADALARAAAVLGGHAP